MALANNVCTAAHDDQVAFQQRISRDFSAPNPARDAVREFVINDVIPVVEGRVAALHGVIANTDRVTWDKAVKDLDQRLSDFKASVEPSQPADLLKATAAPLGTHPGAMLTAYGAKECKNW